MAQCGTLVHVPRMLSRAAAVGVIWAGLVGGVWAAESAEWGGAVNSLGELENGVFSPGEALREGLLELGRSSTVFALNFGNLLIVLGIKLIALFLLGGLGFGFVGRSTDGGEDRSWLDGGDVLFTLAYLVSEGTERYDCLNRLACLDHGKAQELLTAASMMVKGAKILKPIFGYSLEKYDKVAWGLEDAIFYRREGGSCRARYSCSAMPSL